MRTISDCVNGDWCAHMPCTARYIGSVTPTFSEQGYLFCIGRWARRFGCGAALPCVGARGVSTADIYRFHQSSSTSWHSRAHPSTRLVQHDWIRERTLDAPDAGFLGSSASAFRSSGTTFRSKRSPVELVRPLAATSAISVTPDNPAGCRHESRRPRWHVGETVSIKASSFVSHCRVLSLGEGKCAADRRCRGRSPALPPSSQASNSRSTSTAVSPWQAAGKHADRFGAIDLVRGVMLRAPPVGFLRGCEPFDLQAQPIGTGAPLGVCHLINPGDQRGLGPEGQPHRLLLATVIHRIAPLTSSMDLMLIVSITQGNGASAKKAAWIGRWVETGFRLKRKQYQ